LLNQRRAKGDGVIYISDFESWVDSPGWGGYRRVTGTAMLNEWAGFKNRNPESKLVCIDLVPNASAQVTERPDILQVGGFSDRVFDVVAQFVEGGNSENYWVSLIDEMEI
jgi:60 kDa SS-A/Ro ribonucleoprotein